LTPAKTQNAGELQTVIPDFEIESIARCLLPHIQAYFASPEGQAAFEEWKRKQGNT